MAGSYFTKESFVFLERLAENNNRDWFKENKSFYEAQVRTPALNFIRDIADELAMISPHFLAVPKKEGGSFMRVYRDTRFGKDKRPYKTNIGIQFRHEMGKDVHAPGYYLHIEPNECFLGVGIWRPDSQALGKIRQRIDEKGERWIAARDEALFAAMFSLSGDSLIRPPRGFSKDHPLLPDLKRKDFIATAHIDDEVVVSGSCRHQVIDAFALATQYMKFLCQALNLKY